MEQFFVSTVKDVIFDLGVSFRSLKSKAEDIEHTLHSMFGRRYPVEYEDDTPADDPFSGYKSMSQNVNWGIFEELARAAESGELDEPVTPSAKATTETETQKSSDPDPATVASPAKEIAKAPVPDEPAQPSSDAPKSESAPATDGNSAAQGAPPRSPPIAAALRLRSNRQDGFRCSAQSRLGGRAGARRRRRRRRTGSAADAGRSARRQADHGACPPACQHPASPPPAVLQMSMQATGGRTQTITVTARAWRLSSARRPRSLRPCPGRPATGAHCPDQPRDGPADPALCGSPAGRTSLLLAQLIRVTNPLQRTHCDFTRPGQRSPRSAGLKAAKPPAL